MSNQHDRLNSAKEKTFVYKYTYNIIIKWWIIVTIVHNSHHHNDDNIGMVFFLSILASPVSGMSRTAFPDPFRPSSRAWWRSKFASFVPGPGERHRIHHGCWIGGTILQRQLVENFYLTPSKKRFPLVEKCHSYPQFFYSFLVWHVPVFPLVSGWFSNPTLLLFFATVRAQGFTLVANGGPEDMSSGSIGSWAALASHPPFHMKHNPKRNHGGRGIST